MPISFWCKFLFLGPLHTSAEVLQDNKSWDSRFGSSKNVLLQLMALLLIVTSDHSMLYVKTLHVQVQWFLCIQKQCFSSRKIGKACQAKLASALRNLKHVPATEVCVGVFAFKSWSSSWMMTNMVMLVLQMKLLYHPYICVFLSASSMSSFQIPGNTKMLVNYKQIKHWNLANVVVTSWTSSTSACTWYPAEQMIFHLKINNSNQSTSVCCLISPSFWSA